MRFLLAHPGGEGERGSCDKNLYRDGLGRIVNSNGRVIGSIVKKKEGGGRGGMRR